MNIDPSLPSDEIRTLEEVLSEHFGYPIDPVKMLRERQRRGEGVAEPAPINIMPPFIDLPKKSHLKD